MSRISIEDAVLKILSQKQFYKVWKDPKYDHWHCSQMRKEIASPNNWLTRLQMTCTLKYDHHDDQCNIEKQSGVGYLRLLGDFCPTRGAWAMGIA